MTDLDKLTQAKLDNALATARGISNQITEPTAQCILNGALVEAVELLAKLLPQAPKAQDPVCPSELLSNTYKFDEGLVEQLARVFVETPQSDGYVDTWNAQPDRVKESVKAGITAILSELAKAPVESLPYRDVSAAWYAQDVDDHIPDLSAAKRVRTMFAPIIAARDAEIARLNHVAGHQETEITRLRTLTETSASARRIEELETRERYHKERIAELEKLVNSTGLGDGMGVRNIWFAHLQRTNKNWPDSDMAREIFDASFGAGAKAATDVRDDRLNRQAATIAEYEERIAELETRLAEQSTSVDASGKMPGEVAMEAHSRRLGLLEDFSLLGEISADAWNCAGNAVLRAFGGAALRRVSVRAAELMGEFDQSITRRDLQTVIDDELAKLGAKE